MLFNGSAGNEIFEVSANGARVLFTRNLGNIVMDLNDVETIDLNALGGTDTVTVNDLTGTDVTEVKINLAGTIGGTAGDARGRRRDRQRHQRQRHHRRRSAPARRCRSLGLAAQVNDHRTPKARTTRWSINGLGGNDGITATTLPAGVIKLTLDGGAGNDTILGSQGADALLGGDGNDFVFGDNGNDVAFLGAGDDVFQWDPGDGNDTIEGQDGTDTMLFFGSNASENIDIFANGGRVLFFRNVANVTMDLDDVETHRLPGARRRRQYRRRRPDAAPTSPTVDIDLRGPNGGGDGAADTVTVNATKAPTCSASPATPAASPSSACRPTSTSSSPEAANDRLSLNGLGGDDVINATRLEADGIQLTHQRRPRRRHRSSAARATT